MRIVGAIRGLNKLKLNEINLSICFLKLANLKLADLESANLCRANLYRANFQSANLESTALNGVIVNVDWFQKLETWQVIGRGAIIEKYYIDENVTLQLRNYLIPPPK